MGAPSLPTADGERLARNAALFDEAAGAAWRLLVYEPVHGGWRFANVGGRRVLERVLAVARAVGARELLELGSGVGETCCYLAGRAPVRVTGVEMNPRQAAAARANLAERHPAAAARVRFVEADLVEWTPDRRYDLVYAMDALMYLPDRAAVLRRGFRALRPGGALVLAEVLAGPALRAEDRARLREGEGVLQLPTPGEQAALLRAAGFAGVEVEDLTPLAVEVFRAICEANLRHRERLREMGAERFAELEGNRFQLRCFRKRALLYVLTTARRPAEAAEVLRNTREGGSRPPA